MRKTLTQKTLDYLPPCLGKRYEVRDTLLPGFMIRVSKNGGKVWYIVTRVHGRQRRIKIGTYPILSLIEAREKARGILRNKQLGRLIESDGTLSTKRKPSLPEIVPQFIELYAKQRNREWKESRALLGKFSVLGNRPIDEIKRPEVVAVLDSIMAKGTPYRANRALAAIKKLFCWCVDRGVLDFNPLAGLKPPAKETARDRVLTDKELAACWHEADIEDFPFGPFLKLLILTGQRRGEVSGMQWPEIDFERALWTIPARRAKNARQHTVPLAPLAIEILKSIPRFLKSDLVFTTNGKREISGFGWLKRRLDRAICSDDWRVHDIRRTVATNMAIMGIAPHVIEAVLNHKTGTQSGSHAPFEAHWFHNRDPNLRKQLEAVLSRIKGNHLLVLYTAGSYSRRVAKAIMGLLLSYKIERPVFAGFESDSEFALNAISATPLPLKELSIEVDEAKLVYIKSKKAGSMERAGLATVSSAELAAIIRQKISNSYIYNMSYVEEYKIMKFNVILEFHHHVSRKATRLLAALEYRPTEKMLRLLTLY
jgi:integrase